MPERPLYYRLEQGRAVPCTRSQQGYARVGFTLLPDDVTVSTAFFGQDMALTGPPILFETMVFRDGSVLAYEQRYATWAEAEAGHAQAVEWATVFAPTAGLMS